MIVIEQVCLLLEKMDMEYRLRGDNTVYSGGYTITVRDGKIFTKGNGHREMMHETIAGLCYWLEA